MTTPTTQGEEIKSAERILMEYGIELMNTNDVYNCQLLSAMEEYKEQFISPVPDKARRERRAGNKKLTHQSVMLKKTDHRDFRKWGYIAALIDINNYIDMVEADPKIRVSAFALREFMKNKINEKSNGQSEAF